MNGYNISRQGKGGEYMKILHYIPIKVEIDKVIEMHTNTQSVTKNKVETVFKIN